MERVTPRHAFAAWSLALVLFVMLLILRSNRMPETPPSPTTYLTDNVGVLTNLEAAALEAVLSAYDTNSGHQVFVWIGATTGSEAPQTFCPRAFAAWGVGDADENDGVVLFVFTQDDMRGVVVGSGLTQAISDAEAARICTVVVAPKVQANDYAGGIGDGVAAIIAAIQAWEN
jgi:uncharacterized protein